MKLAIEDNKIVVQPSTKEQADKLRRLAQERKLIEVVSCPPARC